MKVIAIAAVSDDGFIAGPDGGIPWRLPRDTAHFRQFTEDQCLLLGRKTYSEMIGWFRPGHRAIVVTRAGSLPADPSITPELATSVQSAIEKAERSGIERLIVCGGAQIYRASLELVDELVITHVHTQIGAGLAFPSISESDWYPAETEPWPMDADNSIAMTLTHYRRVNRKFA